MTVEAEQENAWENGGIIGCWTWALLNSLPRSALRSATSHFSTRLGDRLPSRGPGLPQEKVYFSDPQAGTTALEAARLTKPPACGWCLTGVYGVASYAAAERTREIGVRMALGAQRGKVLQMILSEAMGVVCIGIAFGVWASFAAARMIEGMLWGVRPNDPLSFTSAVCLMLVIAGIAAYRSARRATKVDPMVARRYE